MSRLSDTFLALSSLPPDNIPVLPYHNRSVSISTTPSSLAPSSRSSSILSTSPPHVLQTHGLPSGAIAGIAFGTAAVVLMILLLAFCLVRRRRRHGNQPSTSVKRAESTGYRKPELEGSIPKSTFIKAELPLGEKVIPVTYDNVPLEGPVSARTARPTEAYQELEAVSVQAQPPSRRQVIQSSSDLLRAEQESSTPIESRQSGAATAGKKDSLLRGYNENVSSPKYTATTESTPQDQVVVDVSQLHKLKAEERELAEYIEAHETLQKLKNEHIALQERIKAAEQRAQRSKAIGRD